MTPSVKGMVECNELHVHMSNMHASASAQTEWTSKAFTCIHGIVACYVAQALSSTCTCTCTLCVSTHPCKDIHVVAVPKFVYRRRKTTEHLLIGMHHLLNDQLN